MAEARDNGLDPENVKLVLLARAARGRTGATEGAAVRDRDGRTYAAVTVTLPSLTLSALQLAVAMAVASGVADLEAAAVVTPLTEVDPGGLAAVRDLAPEAPILVANPGGTVLVTVAG
ncbi:MAG TPA: cytidine deaminase [Mycobacteriales bacterium]|nr:cytidine deaminase [Mycobacteriales bacterium]